MEVSLSAVLIVFLIILQVALVAGITYQVLGSARAARRFLPPGVLIDVGGHRLHAYCIGQGKPAVILESGIAASSLSWTIVQPEVAKFTRVCSYDRAGLAWSDACRAPRTPARIVEELHRLLESAGIPAPYVMVGHSFGGFVLRSYAATYPAEVAGMLLVDPIHPSEWLEMSKSQQRVLQGGVFLSRVGAVLARLGVVRLCLSLLSGGAPGVPRRFIKIFGPRAVAVLERLVGEVRKLPEEVLPAVQELWCQPKCFVGMARHLESLRASAAEVAEVGALGDIPLVVLSAGNQPPERVREHVAMTRLSSKGKHLIASRSGHWIHLDEPELVVQSIREIVEAVRAERLAGSRH